MKIKYFNKIYIYAFLGSLFFDRSIWSIYLLKNGIPAFEVGILQTLLSTSMFIFELPSGVISDRFGEKFTIILGHICFVIYSLIMIFTPNFYCLILGFVIYGMGFFNDFWK